MIDIASVRDRSTRNQEFSEDIFMGRTVREVDESRPVFWLKPFEHHLDSNFQLWIVRAGTAMFSVFGALALGLAIVGLTA